MVLKKYSTLFSYHCTDPNVGMSLNKDLGRFKIFLADTGLFVTLCFWDKVFTENVIYQQLLGDKLKANLGYVYENLVAQMLASAGNQLFYYTFPKDEKHNYEVDFLLSRGNKLVPIEVKSSSYKTHKSLDAFCEKFDQSFGCVSCSYFQRILDSDTFNRVVYFHIKRNCLLQLGYVA